MIKSKLNYYVDVKKLHSDILKKLNKIKKPQKYLVQKIGIGRSTLHRMRLGKKIDFDTFLKLLNWIEEEPNNYIKNK